MKEKVLVAMSGGVDSSVAAALLLEQGYEPIGITMRLWNVSNEQQKKSCCSLDDVEDAKRVADALGIPHYTLNMKDDFKKYVVDYFVNEYASGRTPNPCIACNRVLKFELLVNKAKQMGIDKLATGHYAKIETRYGRYLVCRGVDANKDQSYFLFDIPPENMKHILFPLGGLTKDETRDIARKHNLKTAEKGESQEICFVPDDDYKSFLTEQGVESEAGDFVSAGGKKMGRHMGIPFYTIGQRRGLGIGHAHRLYVTEIDNEENKITVGSEDELLSTSAVISNTTFHLPVATGDSFFVQVGYRHKTVEAELKRLDGERVELKFTQPVKAVAPGQAAVLYIDDAVVGGGWIESFTHMKQKGIGIDE